MTAAQAKAGTGTTERVTRLLACLADADGPVAVRQVAGQLGLAPSTTHRLLNLLVESGFASYLPGAARYAAGPEFFRVAHRVTAQTSPGQLARAVIDDLARRHDETVLFGVVLRSSGCLAFAERADGQKKLLYRIEMNDGSEQFLHNPADIPDVVKIREIEEPAV